MSLDKKGFAEIIESAISECNNICEYNKNCAKKTYSKEENNEVDSKYNKYMKKLTLSKIKRLYSILSVPAYYRIISMTNDEIEEYRKEKISELTSSINRLMLAMEVSKNDIETLTVKEKIENLINEQNALKEMTHEVIRKYVIDNLNLNINNENTSFDGKDETTVLENIIKDETTLSNFLNMLEEYKKLEREIKGIRIEQVIIYNDLINNNLKSDISIDELFNEESLKSLQSTIAEKIKEITDAEISIKKEFGKTIKKSYFKIKSDEYKTKNVLPYENGVLEIFESIIPSRTLELAHLQNEEWTRLNKKVFKTTDVSNTLGILCMEIDDTKNLIDSFIREWYKNAYYNNSLFAPVSSRASGKFEYSLGAKTCLDNFINYGIWPEEKDIDTLKLCLKLNRIEAEKSIIYTEQIKERLTRLFNVSLDNKKKELEDLDKKITLKFGNWKNDVILSIVNEVR